jgi:hypothetical protein
MSERSTSAIVQCCTLLIRDYNRALSLVTGSKDRLLDRSRKLWDRLVSLHDRFNYTPIPLVSGLINYLARRVFSRVLRRSRNFPQWLNDVERGRAAFEW